MEHRYSGVLKSFIKYDDPSNDSNMARELDSAFKKHHDRVLLVDNSSRRSYTGRDLDNIVGQIATGLIRKFDVKPGDVVLMICDRSDQEILFALGAIMAGCAIYGSSPRDGFNEEAILCQIKKPDIIATCSRVYHIASQLKREVEGLSDVRIIWTDNPFGFNSNGVETLANSDGYISEYEIVSAMSNTKFDLDCNNNSNQENCNNNNNNSGYPNGNSDFTVECELNRARKLDKVVLLDELRQYKSDKELVTKRITQEIDTDRHVLTYMLTSGSTGRPKVVPSTHKELMHGMYSMLSAARNPFGSAAAEAEISDLYMCPSRHENSRFLLPLDETSVLSGDLPLDHGAGVNTMFLSFILGSKFVVMPSYDEETFWQAVHDHRITSSISSTTFAFKLMKFLKEQVIDANQLDRWDLSCFKFIACAGSKLVFYDLVKEVNRVFDWIKITQCYGCTEIGFIALLRVDDCRTKLAAVGHLFPGITAKLVPCGKQPSEAELIEPNVRGDVHVWSRSRFTRYECLPEDDIQELNKHHDASSFYFTGDMGRYDPEGRLYIEGRFKDTLFLEEDWKILPAELESLIDQHPLVEMSVVVGTPNPDLPGCDAPKAFVKLIQVDSKDFKEQLGEQKSLHEAFLRKDYKIIELDIYKFVADRTAAPKHLKGGVRVVEEFPRVGLLRKVDRNQLKQMP